MADIFSHSPPKNSALLSDRSFQLEILRQTALRHFRRLHALQPQAARSTEAKMAYELARARARYDFTNLEAFLKDDVRWNPTYYDDIASVILAIPLALPIPNDSRSHVYTVLSLCSGVAWLACVGRILGGPMVRKSIVGGIIWLRDMIDMDMRLYPKDGSILEGWRWRILSWI